MGLLLTITGANASFQEFTPTDKGGKNTIITFSLSIPIFCILHIRGILAVAE